MPLAALLAVLKQQPQAARQHTRRLRVSRWTAESRRHQLLAPRCHVAHTARAVGGMAAGRWRCSDVALSSSAQGPRPATQTRPSSSVSALAAAAVVPVVGSAALRVDPGHSRAACIETRAAAMPLAAPFALDQLQQQRMAGTAGLRCQSRLAWRVPRP